MQFDGWETLPFGKVTVNFDSLRIPVRKSDRRAGQYPYYGASGVVDSVDDFIFDGEYLLISEDGENLLSRKTPIAFIANGKFWVNNHAHIVQGNGRALTKFLLYFFADADISGYITGSAQPKLSQDNLNRISVLLPPIDEQRAIVHILGALDDKIELNCQMNRTLEATAQGLFKSWFVEFDPVTAKAAGRKPYGMNENTATLFPKRFAESDLGLIPGGWGVTPIGKIVEVSRESLSPSDYPLEVFAHFSIPAFDEGQMPTLETGDQIKSNKFIVPESCILLSKLNPQTPRVWLPDLDSDHQSIASTEFIVCKPLLPFTVEYLFCLFQDPSFQGDFASLVTGTSSSHQRVKPIDFVLMPTVLPNVEVVEAFAKLAKPIFREIAELRRQSQTLAALRDALLPKLISGEIRIRQAENLVSEAV